jgi:hypothetical protein
MTTKQTSAVHQAALSAAPADSMNVVLELKEMDKSPAPPAASRAEQIRLTKQCFAEHIQPLKDKIESLGGEVLDSAWLNSTISARLPRQGLAELEHDDRVQSIDLPRPIERETGSGA